MDRRKLTGFFSMDDAYAQRRESFFLENRSQVTLELQLSEMLLDSDFPRGCRTHKDHVGGILDQFFGPWGQARVIRKPPQEYMRVQQQVHDQSVPRKSRAIVSSTVSKSSDIQMRPFIAPAFRGF